MKILQINNFHSLRGGADAVYINTGKLLEDKGHNVVYFSTSDNKNVKNKQNVVFVNRVDYSNLSFAEKAIKAPDYIYNFNAFKSISSIIKNFNPDVAHIHLFYGGLTISILKALKRFNIPVVHTVHDYRLLCPAKTFVDNQLNLCESCKNSKFWNCIKKRCSDGDIFQSAIISVEAYFWRFGINPIDLIDHFIFVSKFIQTKHIEFNEAYRNKGSHLYNFNTFDSNQKSALKGDYLFYFGRLSKEKGITTLLNASLHCDFNLVIAGTGPLKGIVEEISSKNDNINYVGFQKGEALNRLIKDSSFVIVPSEWYENNPMTVIESFSLGKPVIGSKIGGIPELVLDGYNGFTFKQGDLQSICETIGKALNISPNDYLKLSRNALNYAVSNFDKEKHYNSLLGIYENVLLASNYD